MATKSNSIKKNGMKILPIGQESLVTSICDKNLMYSVVVQVSLEDYQMMTCVGDKSILVLRTQIMVVEKDYLLASS